MKTDQNWFCTPELKDDNIFLLHSSNTICSFITGVQSSCQTGQEIATVRGGLTYHMTLDTWVGATLRFKDTQKVQLFHRACTITLHRGYISRKPLLLLLRWIQTTEIIFRSDENLSWQFFPLFFPLIKSQFQNPCDPISKMLSKLQLQKITHYNTLIWVNHIQITHHPIATACQNNLSLFFSSFLEMSHWYFLCCVGGSCLTLPQPYS